MRFGNRRRSRQSGFTLIELMIVVVIVAILARIAFAAYDFATVKTRRNLAKGCLLENAQKMERFYTVNLKYDKDLANADVPNPTCTADVNRFYTVSFASKSATAYTLQAVPQAPQDTKDSRCGTLTINQTGAKTPSTSGCW